MLPDHDYSVKLVSPDDLAELRRRDSDHLARGKKRHNGSDAADAKPTSAALSAAKPSDEPFSKRFSKCDSCRRSRTKVVLPDAVKHVAAGKNDGITCDFCGKVKRLYAPVRVQVR